MSQEWADRWNAAIDAARDEIAAGTAEKGEAWTTEDTNRVMLKLAPLVSADMLQETPLMRLVKK